MAKSQLYLAFSLLKNKCYKVGVNDPGNTYIFLQKHKNWTQIVWGLKFMNLENDI